MAKRIIDVIVATIMFVLCGPIFLLIALAVFIAIGWPVLFVQERPGLKGVPFKMYKFRSMCDALGDDGYPLEDAIRLTRFGKVLRATSLDELPELWNVLIGDMSLVGPRPLLMEYLPLYTSEQMRRHDVRPGITGWAQINGRNAISWEKKFALDVWYVDNHNVFLDFYIMALTLLRVIWPKQINQPGVATVGKFVGTPSGRERDE